MSSTTSAELVIATYTGFTLISCPRPNPTTLTKSDIVSDSTAFLIRETSTNLSASTPNVVCPSLTKDNTTLSSLLDKYIPLKTIHAQNAEPMVYCCLG